jgi:hypothetical protein
MYVAQLHPFRLFNVRYALFAYPGFFLLVSVCILSQKRNFFIYTALLLLFVQNILLFYPREPITVVEGKQLYGTDLGMVEAGAYLHTHYHGGNILASSGAIDPLFLFSKIPMKEFIYEGNRDYWQNSLLTPQKYAKWVILTNANNTLDFVAKKLVNTEQFKQNYRFIIHKRNINIYERV